jgi:hypothetical protein
VNGVKKRDKIRARELEITEREFRELLIPCLQACAEGRWGLFGAYDAFPGFENWSPGGNRLRELAKSIRAIRSESGERSELCEEFLTLCTFHKSNDPGEPKLAKAFLERIENRNRETEK